MQSNKWAKWVVGSVLALVLAALVTFYLAGYFYLWHIKQPVGDAGPLTIVRYWMYYGDDARVMTQLKWCLGIAAALVFGMAGLIMMPKKRGQHGDARFATMKEIQEEGLLGEKGIILGVIHEWFGLVKKYLVLPGQLGVILAAPPRSGKGAGIVQPNALSWPDSMVELDIRQESWNATSGFRKRHGQECYLFNPLAEDGKTCQWNPLSYVSDDPILRINDIQKIANMLSPDPEGNSDPFWPASCRLLFLGIALYVFETPGLPRTFGEIVRQVMFGEGESSGEHWKKVIDERQKSGNPLSDICQRALFDFIFTSANTQSSIRKTFTSKLELWLNPLVDAATSDNSFDFRELRKKRISIYVGIAPSDLERVSLICNLFMQQLVDVNTREMPADNPALKYEVLLVFDEFTALGRMNIILKAISYLGGFGLRTMIVIQSPSQLRGTYGIEGAETIIECMGAQVIFAPKEAKHAKEISEILGYDTVKSKSHSRPTGMGQGVLVRGNENTSPQGRALLLPQEVRDIGKEKQIVLIENVKPILCNKVRYWKDKKFMWRLLPAVRVERIKAELPTVLSGAPWKPKEEGKSIAAVMNEKRELKAEDFTEEAKAEMKLSDFSGAPSTVILEKEPISEDELQGVVDGFLASVCSG